MAITNQPKYNPNASNHSRARYAKPSWGSAVTHTDVTPDTESPNTKEQNVVTSTQHVVPSAVVEPLRATVGFERSISVRPYETAKASIFIQTEVSMEDIPTSMANIREACAQAKAAVFEELGIQFSVDEGGYVRELIGKHFGAVTEVAVDDQFPQIDTPAPAVAPASAPQAAGVSSTPPFSVDTKDPGEKRANKAWAKASIAENPDDWYFNAPETKKNPRGPDYKHKSNGMGYWLD
jgi:hypothetical protein